jgi:LysM repeat protein
MRRVAIFAAVFGVATILAAGSRTAVYAAPLSANTKSQTVTVQPGDYLSKLATEYSSTAKRIYNANMQINDPDLIFPGQKLRVPGSNEQLAERAFGRAPSVTVAGPAAPAPVVHAQAIAAPAPAVSGSSVWIRLAQCESGGNWSINTGNGFYGGLQFTMSSWHAVGGTGYPNLASASEQIARAQKLQAAQGWGAWPACSAKLGL